MPKDLSTEVFLTTIFILMTIEENLMSNNWAFLKIKLCFYKMKSFKNYLKYYKGILSEMKNVNTY